MEKTNYYYVIDLKNKNVIWVNNNKCICIDNEATNFLKWLMKKNYKCIGPYFKFSYLASKAILIYKNASKYFDIKYSKIFSKVELPKDKDLIYCPVNLSIDHISTQINKDFKIGNKYYQKSNTSFEQIKEYIEETKKLSSTLDVKEKIDNLLIYSNKHNQSDCKIHKKSKPKIDKDKGDFTSVTYESYYKFISDENAKKLINKYIPDMNQFSSLTSVHIQGVYNAEKKKVKISVNYLIIPISNNITVLEPANNNQKRYSTKIYLMSMNEVIDFFKFNKVITSLRQPITSKICININHTKKWFDGITKLLDHIKLLYNGFSLLNINHDDIFVTEFFHLRSDNYKSIIPCIVWNYNYRVYLNIAKNKYSKYIYSFINMPEIDEDILQEIRNKFEISNKSPHVILSKIDKIYQETSMFPDNDNTYISAK